jgi:hypothetical protein
MAVLLLMLLMMMLMVLILILHICTPSSVPRHHEPVKVLLCHSITSSNSQLAHTPTANEHSALPIIAQAQTKG